MGENQLFVWLNEEGKKVWGDVFPGSKIPVTSLDFRKADLGGQEEVVMVAWHALSKDVKTKVAKKIADAINVPIENVLNEIEKVGLPLRKKYTTGIIAAELRFFI